VVLSESPEMVADASVICAAPSDATAETPAAVSLGQVRRRAAAERQRRFRARALDGDVVVPLRVSTDMVDWLIAEGLLPEARELDREQIAAAILAFIDPAVTRYASDSEDPSSSRL